MPIPFLIMGIIAGSAALGAGTTVKAGVDTNKSKKINNECQYIIELSTEKAEKTREICNDAIFNLGEEKIHVLNNTVNRFITAFEKIHSIEFQESEGLRELGRMRIDKASLGELKNLSIMADSLLKGVAGGGVAGAITAFGAYNGAMFLGTASTGTAISTLSGAAATKATLAFLGGGALKAGGLGIAGGTTVLGGLIAAPALAIFGLFLGAKASANKEKAYSNLAKAEEYEEEMNKLIVVLRGIRLRANMFERLILRINCLLEPLVVELENIVNNSGTDFRKYSVKEKEIVGKSMATAGALKSVIDTPILTDEGTLSYKALSIADSAIKLIESSILA